MSRLRRSVRYHLIIPVFRSRHTAEYTARGVANGVFWGLTPTVGLQSLAILATWFAAGKLFRRESSLLQAFIWVWVNNPITMIPLYYTFYVTGLWLMRDDRLGTGYEAFVDLWSANSDRPLFERLTMVAATIGVPIVLGSIPYALVGAGLSYRWAASVVRRRRHHLQRGKPPRSAAAPNTSLG